MLIFLNCCMHLFVTVKLTIMPPSPETWSMELLKGEVPNCNRNDSAHPKRLRWITIQLNAFISSHNFLPSSSPLETPITHVFGCLKCSHSSGMHFFFFFFFSFFSLWVSFHIHSSSGLLQVWNLPVTHPFFWGNIFDQNHSPFNLLLLQRRKLNS